MRKDVISAHSHAARGADRRAAPPRKVDLLNRFRPMGVFSMKCHTFGRQNSYTLCSHMKRRQRMPLKYDQMAEAATPRLRDHERTRFWGRRRVTSLFRARPPRRSHRL